MERVGVGTCSVQPDGAHLYSAWLPPPPAPPAGCFPSRSPLSVCRWPLAFKNHLHRCRALPGPSSAFFIIVTISWPLGFKAAGNSGSLSPLLAVSRPDFTYDFSQGYCSACIWDWAHSSDGLEASNSKAG